VAALLNNDKKIFVGGNSKNGNKILKVLVFAFRRIKKKKPFIKK